MGLIAGTTDRLAQDLTRIGNLFSRNTEIMTSEVRFTDRIFKFKHNFIDKVFNNTIQTSTSFDTLYFSLTGAVADPGYFPRPYIRWWMNPEDLSVLVRRVGHMLEVRLVSAVERLTFELLTTEA